MIRPARALVVAAVSIALLTGVTVGLAPSFDVTHEYDDHGASLTDVAFADQYQIVFSLDEAGGFIAYNVESEEVEFHHQFGERAHALAIGDEAVYIAVSDTLWVYDVPAGELSELTTLDSHAGDMAYDAQRDVVWIAGHETVYGYNADDGSDFMQYTEHSDGLNAIAVQGDYVATGTTFESEVVVYDVAAESVAFQPDLPDDVVGIGALDLTESGDLIVGTGAENDDVIAAYDIESGEQRLQYRQHIFGVSYVEYEPTTDAIISAGADNTVKFYDVSEGSVTATYQHPDTIYTADLDRSNGILWIGDGEERTGTVTGLAIITSTPTPTPSPTPTDTPSPTASPTPTATDSPAPATDPPTTTESGGQPGFGPVAALLGVLGLTLLRRRLG